jgi:ArsR family transcriptional regulator
MTEPSNQFDTTRAELFEALGHPVRVRILQALETKPMGFAELKKEVGIESSGHLEFHLRKLSGLVGTTAEGSYALTDDGKEAIRVLKSTGAGIGTRGRTARVLSLRSGGWNRALLAVFLVALVLLAMAAVYQENQIASLNHELSSEVTTIGGTRYYYENGTFGSNGTRILFRGVTFTILTWPLSSYSNPKNYTFMGSLWLPNGTLLNLNGKTVILNMQGECVGKATCNPVPQSSVLYSYPIGWSVTFPDGSEAVDSGFNLSATYQHAYNEISMPVYILTYIPVPIASNWFIQHGNLSVGIQLDPLTFYVSAPS